MQDRIPLYPGRVKLAPVAGQENTYDMVRADEPQQEGTPINKNSLLKDSTAAALGLTEDAVPDDAFKVLGSVALLQTNHVWKRRPYQIRTEPGLVMSGTLASVGAYVSSSDTVYYAASYTVDYATGIFTLTDPVSSSWADYGTYYSIGKPYIMVRKSSDTVLYEGLSQVQSSTSAVPANKYTAYPIIGEWGIVIGNSAESYPQSGIVDGYEYDYLGNAQDVAFGAKIETGSYVGTGTYGSSNPNSLTFDFTPKLVIVTGVKFVGGTLTSIIPSNSYWEGCFIWIAGMVRTYVGDSNKTMEFGQSENTLSWYTNGTSAGNQCNTLNDTYAYIAIG